MGLGSFEKLKDTRCRALVRDLSEPDHTALFRPDKGLWGPVYFQFNELFLEKYCFLIDTFIR